MTHSSLPPPEQSHRLAAASLRGELSGSGERGGRDGGWRGKEGGKKREGSPTCNNNGHSLSSIVTKVRYQHLYGQKTAHGETRTPECQSDKDTIHSVRENRH